MIQENIRVAVTAYTPQPCRSTIWRHDVQGLTLVLIAQEIHIERRGGQRDLVDQATTMQEAAAAELAPQG